MALTPNAVAKMNGVTINEKIIPDGSKWKSDSKAKKAGFSGAGALYKAQKKLCGTGYPKSITIHNTNDLANVNDDAEQYTRATWPNENMNSARVHYYVDDLGAWQNLRAGSGLFAADPVGSAEVSWHSGDGSVSTGGNMTSISIEVIMGRDANEDIKARENAAKMVAWMLKHYGLTIENVVSHTYWVNHAKKNFFDDVDKQCTNKVSGKKWCPTYIFNSSNNDTAYKNWKSFKTLIQSYLDQLNAEEEQGKIETTAEKIITGLKDSDFTLEEIIKILDIVNGSFRGKEEDKKDEDPAPVTPDPVKPEETVDDKKDEEQPKVEPDPKPETDDNQSEEVVSPTRKSLDEIAKEVIRGNWGNGQTRKNRLREAGYSDEEIKLIQQKVNAYFANR